MVSTATTRHSRSRHRTGAFGPAEVRAVARHARLGRGCPPRPPLAVQELEQSAIAARRRRWTRRVPSLLGRYRERARDPQVGRRRGARALPPGARHVAEAAIRQGLRSLRGGAARRATTPWRACAEMAEALRSAGKLDDAGRTLDSLGAGGNPRPTTGRRGPRVLADSGRPRRTSPTPCRRPLAIDPGHSHALFPWASSPTGSATRTRPRPATSGR